MLDGALQDVVHLVHVVRVQAKRASEREAVVGLVGALLSGGKPQVNHGFGARATAEEAVGEGEAAQHVKVLVHVDWNHVARDVKLLSFCSNDLRTKFGHPVVGVEFFEVDVGEFHVAQDLPGQFSHVSGDGRDGWHRGDGLAVEARQFGLACVAKLVLRRLRFVRRVAHAAPVHHRHGQQSRGRTNDGEK